ncbi:short chain dehydrogenase [Ordospora pajunii]|uniref:short chain dehydrogenase n=1 Tax=Ordospora pajunii TaxID=3039483 RepID=UPI002952869B|nr:short chain dehydrogenase [Ordospora pajunii]KAH9410935.1 short chain dehydrogenase [Ordospora pajunii]
MIVQVLCIYAAYMLSNVIPAAYQYIYSRCRNHQVWDDIKGRHVLINGATGSIGAALALEFANRGMKIVLVGKNESKLVKIHLKISQITECHMYIIDYTKKNNFDFIDKYDIRVLVNCVGTANTSPGYFVEHPFEEIIKTNLEGPVVLMKRILANMMENGCGYVLSIGPLMENVPSPLYSSYGCSKAGLVSLSNSLYYELEECGINVEYAYFGYMGQSKDGQDSSSVFRPSPRVLACSILSTFGSGKACIPYLPHFLVYLVIICIPSPLLNRLIFFSNRQKMIDERKRMASCYKDKDR